MLTIWLSQWVWVLPYACFALLLLLFPTGKLLSSRWRWVAGAVLMLLLLLAILAAFTSPMMIDASLAGSVPVPNPVGLWEPTAEWLDNIIRITGPLLLLLILLSAASIALRWRRAGSDERQQIKVVVYVVLMIVVVLIVEEFIGESVWYEFVVNGAFLLLPVAFALAILRYRLYDIDVVIRRTLAYAVLTGLLALVYFSSVILLQQLFTTRAGQEESPIAIVLSTLLIAALFTPLRRRVQKIIDRRFFRQRYDAQQVLERFGAMIRNETDPDQLTAELIQVVQQTMQPASVGVWLRKERPPARMS